MKKIITTLILLAGLILVSCSTETGAPPTSPTTQEEMETPTSAPTPTPAEVAQADDSSCFTCHATQETLQALAQEPEDTEELSEGEG
jgi:hypothetical protein